MSFGTLFLLANLFHQIVTKFRCSCRPKLVRSAWKIQEANAIDKEIRWPLYRLAKSFWLTEKFPFREIRSTCFVALRASSVAPTSSNHSWLSCIVWRTIFDRFARSMHAFVSCARIRFNLIRPFVHNSLLILFRPTTMSTMKNLRPHRFYSDIVRLVVRSQQMRVLHVSSVVFQCVLYLHVYNFSPRLLCILLCVQRSLLVQKCDTILFFLWIVDALKQRRRAQKQRRTTQKGINERMIEKMEKETRVSDSFIYFVSFHFSLLFPLAFVFLSFFSRVFFSVVAVAASVASASSVELMARSFVSSLLFFFLLSFVESFVFLLLSSLLALPLI